MPKVNKKKFRHSSTFYRKVKQKGGVPESKFQEPENRFLHDPVMPLNQHMPVDEILEFPSGDSTCEVQINLKPGSNIKPELIQWALKYSIPHVALTDLLILLKNELKLEELPRNSRTLIGTPSSCSIVPMRDGHFWYNGIQKNLYQQSFLTELNKDKAIHSISLIFNIDGLPPFNSSPLQFWPILLKVHEYPKLKPMAVAIYCGPTKPPLQEYFKQFVEELNTLLENGFYLNNRKIKILVRYFVCDTPARSFIKGKYHYYCKILYFVQ